MMTELLIHSIYRATEGEGIHIGIPQIFVRFQGCTVGCVNCDSKDTWNFDESKAISLENVLAQVERLSLEGQFPLKRVSITGGDPLHPLHVPALRELVKHLKERGYYINLEAAGTRVIEDIFEMVDFISYDIKTPSTQVRTSLDLVVKMHRLFPLKTQIKSVIADNHDFAKAVEAYRFIQTAIGPIATPWVLTPCFETHEKFPEVRFEHVLKLNEDYGGIFRVVGQQHKWVYGPSAQLV